LDWLDVIGAIVTICDGLSKKHYPKDCGQGGRCVIALKGNQESLHDDVKLHFEQPTFEAKASMLCAETVDKGHGRIEVISNESERHIGDSVSKETRYFIGSKTVTTTEALTAVRSHWGIENQLHWILDMSFGEDQSRIRQQNAPTNVAIIRHAALNMIRQVKTKRVSVSMMRKSAGWNNSVLAHILSQIFL
jgi:predicted transposase YbfD/YdcC